jgi:hypothetical protein
MPNSLWKTDSIPRSKPNSCKIEMRTGLTWTKSSSHGWIVITWSPYPYRDSLSKTLQMVNILKNGLHRTWTNKQQQHMPNCQSPQNQSITKNIAKHL